MPEEEEEEEQEEDESVPDLTGFVLEDMKLYVHIVYIYTLWTVRQVNLTEILLLLCDSENDLMTPDDLCNLGDTTALSPNCIQESSAIPAACVLLHLRRMCMRIIWTGTTGRIVQRRTSVRKLHTVGGTTV